MNPLNAIDWVSNCSLASIHFQWNIRARASISSSCFRKLTYSRPPQRQCKCNV